MVTLKNKTPSSTEVLHEKGSKGFLGEQFRDRLGLYQLAGLVEVVVDQGLGIDAERMINGGEKFARMNRFVDWSGSGLVGLSVNIAALDAGARNDAGVAIGPVVAAVGAVAVAGGAYA